MILSSLKEVIEITRDRREYMREYNRKYKAEHREQSREYNRQYNAEHREERREYARKRYLANHEKMKQQALEYAESHREQINEKRRRRYAEHREQELEYRKRRYKKMKLAKKLGLVFVKGKFITPEQKKTPVTEVIVPKKRHHSEVYTRSDRATRHEQLVARRGAFWDFVAETLSEYDREKSMAEQEKWNEYYRERARKKSERMKSVD